MAWTIITVCAVFVVLVGTGWKVYTHSLVQPSVKIKKVLADEANRPIKLISSPALAPRFELNRDSSDYMLLAQQQKVFPRTGNRRNITEFFPTVGKPGSRSIKESTRASIYVNKFEPKDYGLYSYLLFGSNSKAGNSKRIAAIQAYLRLFPSVADPSVKSLPIENLNIFIAPTLRPNIIGALEASYTEGDSLKLLANYDFFRARSFLRRIDQEGDGIYLVSYFEPIGRISEINKQRLLVQDLSNVPPHLIELWILDYRRQVRNPRYWNESQLRTTIRKLRTALPEIAKFIKFAGIAIAGENGN